MRVIMFRVLRIGIFSIIIVYLVSCAESTSDPFNERVFGDKFRRLYVATGACYAGGVATSPGPSNLIAKLDVESGAVVQTVVDYNEFNPGDSPIAIEEYDSERLLVLVENAAGRRIDLVNKNNGEVTLYLANATALSAVTRAMVMLPDFGLLVSKSTSVEKFNSAKSRVTQGANPYINAPAGACATSTALISSIVTFPNGKIMFAHAAAGQARIGLISQSGYAAAGDCLVAQAAPIATAFPTRIINHSSGHTLVSYGSTTAASNLIYSYSVDSVSNTIGGATAAWTDFSIVNGPSAMVEDPMTGDVYIASGNSTFNTIERFNYNPGTRQLTRAGTTVFKAPSVFSRCVTDMKVLP
jgi:hypothetical protein